MDVHGTKLVRTRDVEITPAFWCYDRSAARPVAESER
jgi:hypothetical protein